VNAAHTELEPKREREDLNRQCVARAAACYNQAEGDSAPRQEVGVSAWFLNVLDAVEFWSLHWGSSWQP
jgi:hypothetical protein